MHSFKTAKFIKRHWCRSHAKCHPLYYQYVIDVYKCHLFTSYYVKGYEKMNITVDIFKNYINSAVKYKRTRFLSYMSSKIPYLSLFTSNIKN